MVCNVDFAATFLDFAGIDKAPKMRGVSFRACLQGRAPEDWPQLAYHRYWMHRDFTHNVYAHYGVRDHRYKLIFWYNEGYNLLGTNEGGQDREWELFDLEQDPLELFNVYPDPNYADVQDQMLDKLDTMMAAIGDTAEH